jgi:hypothetical protein
MDCSVEPADDEAVIKTGSHGAPFRLRAYQAEMVEESMNSNIICVMDTGSGKTHMYFSCLYHPPNATDTLYRAIDRTRAELEIRPSDKVRTCSHHHI